MSEWSPKRLEISQERRGLTREERSLERGEVLQENFHCVGLLLYNFIKIDDKFLNWSHDITWFGAVYA